VDNPTPEDLLGTVQTHCASSAEDAAEFLTKLRRDREELVAVSHDGYDTVIYYRTLHSHRKSSYWFTIHDLIAELNTLPEPTRKAAVVQEHVAKLPFQGVIAARHLAAELTPARRTAHVIGRDEMAALLLRAYHIGVEAGRGHD
jgi:hypothetical protein